MITIDKTAVEEALAQAAPLHDQAHVLQSVANTIEAMALATWYQALLRQVINANDSPNQTTRWSIRQWRFSGKDEICHANS